MTDRIVNIGNNAVVQTPEGGTLVLGNPVWTDLRVSLNSAKPGASEPDYTKVLDNGDSSTGVSLWLFDKNTEQELSFTAQFPHSYQLNTAISPHVHWIPTVNGGAGAKVNWGLEYTWSDIGDVFGNTTISYANNPFPADTTLVAKKHYLSSFPDIEPAAAGAGGGVSSILICRLFRDAGGTGGTDDYDADAGALYFDFHFLLDTLGSREETSK